MDQWRRRFYTLLLAVLGLPLLIAVPLAVRFLPDRPVTYANDEDNFKYGSTGGYRSSGFPYWIWQALPVVFADRLPQNGRPGYEAFGLVFEKGHDLPIGMQRGRSLGLDRVFVNCAICHHSTVRDTPEMDPPRVYLGMPAARFDLGAFEQFLFDCVTDERFRADDIVPEIERQAGKLGFVDRYVVYPLAIGLMQQRILMLRQRFEAFHIDTWGPGRVDTFNSAKALFNFPFHRLPERELWGAADFPSIWNQGPRRGMALHWDGNNNLVDERNKSAAFGTGTTPASLDVAQLDRIEHWLDTLKAPAYPYPIKQELAANGRAVYQREGCGECHDFGGKKVGKVTPIGEIGTDRSRLDSYTYELAVNQSMLYAGEPYRFNHFRKTFGYANAPLDGIWLRAPYLHNGSVPTLRDLLTPPAQRPKSFFRGYDVYDQRNVGFVSTVGDETVKPGVRRYFQFNKFDPKDGRPIPGNDNSGHSYGTNLSPADKEALLEYLKTL